MSGVRERFGWREALLAVPLGLVVALTAGVVLALASRLSLGDLGQALAAPETRFAKVQAGEIDRRGEEGEVIQCTLEWSQ